MYELYWHKKGDWDGRVDPNAEFEYPFMELTDGEVIWAEVEAYDIDKNTWGVMVYHFFNVEMKTSADGTFDATIDYSEEGLSWEDAKALGERAVRILQAMIAAAKEL